MELLAQVDIIVANPPVDALRAWWPLIVTVAAGGWTYWQSLQANKWQSEAKARADQMAVETKRLEAEYEARKEFIDDLMVECKELRLECAAQREENQKLRVFINERDESISLLRSEIQALERQVIKLQTEVDSLEQTRVRMGQT